jgi:NMD protein affecting ribosome stability and mRNA decay
MIYFICQRCKAEVEYDDGTYDPPEDLLCEDCYLEAHNSVGD